MLRSVLDIGGFNYMEEKVICRNLFSMCIFTRRGIFNQNNISFGFFSFKKGSLLFFFLTVIFGHLKIHNNKKVIYFSCGALIAATFTF